MQTCEARGGTLREERGDILQSAHAVLAAARQECGASEPWAPP